MKHSRGWAGNISGGKNNSCMTPLLHWYPHNAKRSRGMSHVCLLESMEDLQKRYGQVSHRWEAMDGL